MQYGNPVSLGTQTLQTMSLLNIDIQFNLKQKIIYYVGIRFQSDTFLNKIKV